MAFVSLSELQPQRKGWLWPNRIPFGAITVLDGDSGNGKSTLSHYLAAQVTRGRPMHNCTGKPAPGGVLLLQTEDDLEASVLPSLKALGADLSLVRAYDRRGGGDQPLLIPDGLKEIERQAAEINARLIVFNPIMAFLGTNACSYQSMCKSLGQVAALADRLNVAVLGVRHMVKGSNGSPLHRGVGSVGITGAIRSGLLVSRHPGDSEQIVLAQYKNSLGPLARSLSFQFQNQNGGLVPQWVGEVGYTVDDLLDAARADDRSALREAIYVLFSVLAEGPLLASAAKSAVLNAGVSSATLKRAKKVLRIESFRKGFGRGSTFYWELPSRDGLVQQLRENELGDLMDKLIHGDDDDDDPSDWWKGGSPNDDDDNGGIPIHEL
jgi:hypothetical protein